MPELPEVETVRRMLQAQVVGRRVARARRSRLKLHVSSLGTALHDLVGRRLEGVDRRGKYLLFRFERELTMLSHLGMSGRWLFFASTPKDRQGHVHARLDFEDGASLLFQDPRRFGQLRLLRDSVVEADPSLQLLGRDPVTEPLSANDLADMSERATVAVKNLLLDQRRIAGIGNIYASEILHRARVDPRRRAGTLTIAEWKAVAREIPNVLNAAIERMGTTFSSYRTLANEPGNFSERLLVYDRAGEPCRTCGTSIRRLVQGQRSTFYCPSCQSRRARASGPRVRPKENRPTKT